MRCTRALSVLAPIGVALAAGSAAAATLSVGAGQTYPTIAEAAAAAADNDIIEIHAGTYREAVTWRAAGLTVRGVGGRPVIDMTGMPISNGKGIFVVDGSNFTVENVELVGATVGDRNGAGIRWESPGSLTVRGCIFRSNENGILGGGAAHPENTAVIEQNEFVDNGRGDVGYTHSVYFGDAESVTFRGNWSHALWPDGADVGHLFKSRARHTYVLYNRLTAEGTHSSYEINMPQGGDGYVIGNLIQQRVGDQRVMISFADGDGTQYPGSALRVVNNTFVSESSGDATFIRTSLAEAVMTVRNNLVIGPGTLVTGGVITMDHNLVGSAADLVSADMFDYHLVAGSAAIDAGGAPGTDVTPLMPAFQYVHPTSLETRVVVGSAIDVGAYEFGNAPVLGDDLPPGRDAGTDGGGDDPGAPGDGSGCCSAQHSLPSGSLALVVGVGIALGGRRRRRSK